jgi:RecB family exonuclease
MLNVQGDLGVVERCAFSTDRWALCLEHWALIDRPTPRVTRLIRTRDLRAFRDAAISFACEGSPLEARDRIVVVPTRAAAAHLRDGIEARALARSGAVIVPELVTPRDLIERLAERLDSPRRMLTGAEREALLGSACRDTRAAGHEPPFEIRPGLIAEILRFYDELRLRRNSVDDFERRALYLLEPGASTDRGAERLVSQTRFLAAAFREFERQVAEHGEDEHARRERLATTPAARPWRHIVLTVTDGGFDPYGLLPADWDLLTRIPRLERLDAVVTDTMLAGALHERIHHVLPGIEEVPFETGDAPRMPVLLTSGDERVQRARDREEEVASFARRIKAASRRGELASPGRAAFIVRRPLPYVYVAREVMRSAGVACQTFDALPLAAEPYAAAMDLVLSCVSTNFARGPAIALLRSPHFRFGPPRGGPCDTGAEDGSYGIGDVPALDRALAEAGYLGDADSLDRLLESWRSAAPARGRMDRALRAGEVLAGIVRELVPLRSRAPVSTHLECLLTFLMKHGATQEDQPSGVDDSRARRARGAIFGTLVALRDGWARFDETPVDSDVVAALIRRWIEVQTFAPRAGDSGVHLVDAWSARFGDFDEAHLAGLVDGEWPEPARRSIFYSTSILRELGWPAEADRLAGERALFADLLRLPSSRLSASVFTLEGDALVSPSSLIDELDHAGHETTALVTPSTRIFEYEALCFEPVDIAPLRTPEARAWAERRARRLNGEAFRARALGWTDPHRPPAYALSALERYQDCPFKFFASDVLRLEEVPEDESTLSPRARGRFIHEVFQRFFEAWDARGLGAITAESLDEARELMAELAEPLLARLPAADAALERSRLFGSAISTGSVDVVFEREVSSDARVVARRLEHRLEGEFALGSPDGRRVPLKGVADRIDVLEGNRLRVIDYKTGSAPNPRRALQVPIYALSAQERESSANGDRWTIDEAAYIAFSGKRSYVPVVRCGSAADEVLNAARERLHAAVDGIERGEFPARPHDPIMCTWCAFVAVCRKDYVDHD